MDVAPHQATCICSHCDRAIPSTNLDLHFAHCSRNLEKCKICEDMVPKKFAEEHFLSTHAPVKCPAQILIVSQLKPGLKWRRVGCRVAGPLSTEFRIVACSLCSETMEREILAVHKGENCPKRIVTCEYCEFPLPAIDLFEHQEVCGNRTELCHLCSRYIRLRERDIHESRCNGIISNVGESSRRNTHAAERDRGPPRRQPQEFSKKRLLFTIAITGIAVLLGSLLFQRKVEQTQVH